MTALARNPLAPAAARRRGRGMAYAVACAAAFSVNAVTARLAFEGGTNAATANAARFGFTVLVLLAWHALRRARPSLTPRQRLGCLALGIPYFLTTLGYLSSIQYIPVSMTVLIVYTYPILVGLITRVTGRAPLGRARIAALLLAFVGVSLALDIRAEALPDWRGVALAGLSSLAMAALVTGGDRLMREVDRGALNLQLSLAAAVLFMLVLAVSGGPIWPATRTGWIAFAALPVVFTFAQLCLIAAIGRAGPVLTAAVMNLEPVGTIALAVLVIGESLSLVQLLGAVLVFAAIVLMSRADARAAVAAGPATAP